MMLIAARVLGPVGGSSRPACVVVSLGVAVCSGGRFLAVPLAKAKLPSLQVSALVPTVGDATLGLGCQFRFQASE